MQQWDYSHSCDLMEIPFAFLCKFTTNAASECTHECLNRFTGIHTPESNVTALSCGVWIQILYLIRFTVAFASGTSTLHASRCTLPLRRLQPKPKPKRDEAHNKQEKKQRNKCCSRKQTQCWVGKEEAAGERRGRRAKRSSGGGSRSSAGSRSRKQTEQSKTSRERAQQKRPKTRRI